MKFPLGQIVATPGALEVLEETGTLPFTLLNRHANGDWGDICDEDKQLNVLALKDDARILSAYDVFGRKLWVITDADRSVTTILLPEEY